MQRIPCVQTALITDLQNIGNIIIAANFTFITTI